ncbi:hypothetical protein MRB53_039795 [Persea americana]|nr:hypothetical protein MRB53_039795 [Persea americana]
MSFDRDLKRKEKAKYDDRFDEMARDAESWIAELIGHPLPPAPNVPGGGDLCDRLKDGTILCELVNTIAPNSTRYKKSAMPFIQMENIAAFLKFSSEVLKIPAHDLFQTIDLYERKNVFQVVQSIHTVSRYAATYHAKQNPGQSAIRFLGPRMSTSVSREFTQEQLNEAKNHVNTYQYGRTNGSTNVLRSSRRDPAGNIV